MANYHIKTPGKLGVGDVYWKGDNTWTQTYADRKVYTNRTTANTQAATKTISPQGVEYQSDWWKNSTVVTG